MSGTRRRQAAILAFCLLIAAAINVPFAVTRMWPRNAQRPKSIILHGAEVPKSWPAVPAQSDWPAPNSWIEQRAWGVREIKAFGNRGPDHFSMAVTLVGWPLPVLEFKTMAWNMADATRAWTQPDPPPSLRLGGLILNPVIVGGGFYVIALGPFVLYWLIKRVRRQLRGQCIDCGYDLRGSPTGVCPECGTPKRERPVL